MTALLSLGLAATEIAVTFASTVAVYSCVPDENAGLILPGEIPKCARLLSEDLVLVVAVLEDELPDPELPVPELLPEELLPEEVLPEELPLFVPVLVPVSAPASGPATVSCSPSSNSSSTTPVSPVCVA